MRGVFAAALFVATCASGNDGALPVGRSDSDAAGLFSAWVDFPEQPVTVLGGDEANVYRRSYYIQVPAGELVTVWTFIGTDAGDHFEADVELVSPEGLRLYQRSLHHHRAEDYDAWGSERVGYTCAAAGGCLVEVILLGRVTDRNTSEQNPNYGQLVARFHFGLRMTIRGSR